MVLVGVLLIAGLGLIVVESVGYLREGYGSGFWALPLDDKLDHVAKHRWGWWWISIWELAGLLVVTAGMAGLTSLLVEEGEAVLASIGFGAYLVALFPWAVGLIIQTASVSKAADERTERGDTPAWMHPFWTAGYFAEWVWVIGSNIAYATIGLALAQSSLVGGWAGWTAIGLGLLIPASALITRSVFPQLGLIVPAIAGVALLIEAI